MRKVILILIIIIVLIPTKAGAAEDYNGDIENEILNAINELDLDNIEKTLEKYEEELSLISNGEDIALILKKIATGEIYIDFKDIGDFIINGVLSGVTAAIPVIIQIILICLLFALLEGFTGNISNGTISKTAYYSQYILICSICTAAFSSVFSSGTALINSLSDFSSDIFPILFLILTAIGGNGSAAILKPATSMISSSACSYIKTVVFPILLIICVLSIINSFSKTIKLKGFVEVGGSIIKWSLGVVFIVFLGFLSLQSIVSASYDGISMRAAKYTIDKVIPVVGGMFSDSLDMIIISSALIKNAVGVLGIIIVFALTFIPMITVFVNSLVFKLAGVALSPIAHNGVYELMFDMSNIFKYLTAIIATVSIMFIVMIAVIMAAGNINISLR